MTEAQIIEKIEEYTRRPQQGKLTIVRDTTEFMNIESGHVLELEGRYYLARGDAVEGRFGIDEQPKFWVKKAIDLEDGSSKIIKLVFYESFIMHLGDLPVECFRSPRKESRILKKVQDDPYFMHGFTVRDSAGNTIRVVEKILGPHFYDVINKLDMDHQTYFHEHFPVVLDNVVKSVEAIDRLHRMGELHGDIRNDHLFIDRETGFYRWIDFDYTYEWTENPVGVDLFGLGNVLLFTFGKGFHHLKDVTACAPEGMTAASCLGPDDLSLFFKHRVINLKKLFPYIPESLNHVLMHFSHGAEVFYENTQELLNDLKTGQADLAISLGEK